MGATMEKTKTPKTGTGPYLSVFGAWAFALGTSIGWGSLVVTGSAYLAKAGPAGSLIGMIAGLAIMMAVAGCYHSLIQGHSNPGGVYGYTRDIFGYDHAALVAWFLALVYIAMFWANASALPLFARYFLGDLFQFGLHYQLFGYDVYLGEALLSITFIALAAICCTFRKRAVSILMVSMAAIITIGITVCFAGAMVSRDAAQFPFDPIFNPDSSPLVQVIHIACISSWAFIGFESISNSSDEFSFPKKRTMRVFAVSLVSVTALYVFVTLLSITAFPPEYANWLEYITDLPNLSGVAGIPAFYAAGHYLGILGTNILMAVLICLILTSLVGNLVALSRLLRALAIDEVIPERLAELNDNGVPARAILAIALVSIPIPFLGRTTIGWIVDVTTLGATIIYGFVGACAIREGRLSGNRTQRSWGLFSLVMMVVFAAYLLLPSVFAASTMATESYFLFAVWAIIGFLYFRRLLSLDTHRRYGKSTITWVALLALIVFTSLAWMGQTADIVARDTIQEIQGFYAQQVMSVDATAEQAALSTAVADLDNSITGSMFVVAGMFMFSLLIMLSNFNVMSRREEQSHQRATVANTAANTDPLTGVKSKHAYVNREVELNRQIEGGEAIELGIVVCDVNGLKAVNDNLGHKAGDEYIRSASRLICGLYKHSPVYRIGGDEFVVLLQGEDFEMRTQILAELNRQVEENRDNGKVVIAAGMAVLEQTMDTEVHAVFERADALMYNRKRELKRPGEEIR